LVLAGGIVTGWEKVCWTLERLLTEKRKRLQALLEEDKTRKEIDEVVAEMFRIHMAISLLKEKEVIPSEQTQPGTRGSSQFQRRGGSSGGVSRLREDEDHDRAYSQAGNEP
jgi:hypothetical protein